MKRLPFTSLILFATLGVCLPACADKEGQVALPATTQDRTADVPLLKVASESIRVAVKATGTAQPIRAANLGPQTTARIEEIMVSEGSVVEKGQGLVRLDVQGARLRACLLYTSPSPRDRG